LKSKIFLNVSPNTLGDGREVLFSTLEAVEDAGLLREQIVFEIVESECIDDVPLLKSALAGFAKAVFVSRWMIWAPVYASLQLLGTTASRLRQVRPRTGGGRGL
jgi:hypothetical protein